MFASIIVCSTKPRKMKIKSTLKRLIDKEPHGAGFKRGRSGTSCAELQQVGCMMIEIGAARESASGC